MMPTSKSVSPASRVHSWSWFCCSHCPTLFTPSNSVQWRLSTDKSGPTYIKTPRTQRIYILQLRLSSCCWLFSIGWNSKYFKAMLIAHDDNIPILGTLLSLEFEYHPFQKGFSKNVSQYCRVYLDLLV